MSEPREIKTPAIVLRRARLKEADRIITLFTRELGKVSALARGVRKSTSKLAGHLETLNYADVTLARGKNLHTIIGSQTLNPHLGVRSSLERTSYALYFAELVYLFTPEEQPNIPVFELLAETLESAGSTENLELLSRYFELCLLKTMGFQPQLRVCISCGAELKAVTNYFSNTLGGTLCPNCATTATVQPVSVNGLKVLRFFTENNSCDASRLKLSVTLNKEIKLLLSNYLRFLLEREIKCTSWLHQLEISLLASSL